MLLESLLRIDNFRSTRFKQYLQTPCQNDSFSLLQLHGFDFTAGNIESWANDTVMKKLLYLGSFFLHPLLIFVNLEEVEVTIGEDLVNSLLDEVGIFHFRVLIFVEVYSKFSAVFGDVILRLDRFAFF